jgi:peptidoglycan/xylan/chitin deacetylase (PgdA/CDA1 family)
VSVARSLAVADAAIPILLYHSVSDAPLSGHGGFAVSPHRFREQARAIVDSGRTGLTVAELAAALRRERTLPDRPVVITFDDGFADVAPAAELLLRAGFPTTAFVTSGWVGRFSMLTPAGLRDLAGIDPRVEVGAHAVTHARLDELAEDEAAAEIGRSKGDLEAMVQAAISSFAYPHGAYDVRVRDAVVRAGFKAAVAVKNAASHAADDVFALSRITIGGQATARDVERLLSGSGVGLAWRGERLRTRGYRSFRRLARGLGRPVA